MILKNLLTLFKESLFYCKKLDFLKILEKMKFTGYYLYCLIECLPVLVPLPKKRIGKLSLTESLLINDYCSVKKWLEKCWCFCPEIQIFYRGLHDRGHHNMLRC